MSILIDIVSWALFLAGGGFVVVGAIGALRMPDLYTRMHAAGITDTMGTILILAGALLQAGVAIAVLKVAAIGVFLLLTSPTAAYALANAARLGGLRIDRAAREPREAARQ